MDEIECKACRDLQESFPTSHGFFKCLKCGETFCFHHIMPVVEVEPKVTVTWICEACFDGKEVE